jgi:uncharacterized protein
MSYVTKDCQKSPLLSAMNREFDIAISIYDYPVESSSLEVKESWILGGAFLGLFAKTAIPEGQVVCEYFGAQLSTVEAMRSTDKSYLMRLGPQTYIDARLCLRCLARFINDCRNPLGYNVRFDKKPDKMVALVTSIRDIEPGEEIFVDYGKWYWATTPSTRLSVSELLRLRGIVK